MKSLIIGRMFDNKTGVDAVLYKNGVNNYKIKYIIDKSVTFSHPIAKVEAKRIFSILQPKVPFYSAFVE